MRAYNVSDVFTMVDLLSGIAGSAGDELRGLLTSGSSAVDDDNEDKIAQERGFQLVMFVLSRCYAGCKDKLITWFASLCEMSEKEFLAQPPETVLDVIEEIASRKESKDFFSRAYRLFSQIGASGTVTSGA